MNAYIDLANADWQVKTDKAKLIQEGQLTLKPGVVMNDQYSQVIFEHPLLTQ